MKKNPHAQALGKLGGLARTKALTKDQRIEAARHAAKSRHRRNLPSDQTSVEAYKTAVMDMSHYTTKKD
jgi:hypothetical protein